MEIQWLDRKTFYSFKNVQASPHPPLVTLGLLTYKMGKLTSGAPRVGDSKLLSENY